MEGLASDIRIPFRCRATNIINLYRKHRKILREARRAPKRTWNTPTMRVLMLLVESGAIYSAFLVSDHTVASKLLDLVGSTSLCSLHCNHRITGRGRCIQRCVTLALRPHYKCEVRLEHSGIPCWLLYADSGEFSRKPILVEPVA